MAMVISNPSKLSETRALVAQLGLSYKIFDQILDLLDDYDVRLYALQEDKKRLLADYRQLSQELALVRKQYTEALYKISELSGK